MSIEMMIQKILIIDDDKALRELYDLSFKQAGFESVSVTDKIDGLALFETENPDMVLLDIMMPQISGFEFLPKLTADREKNMQIVVNSNLDQSDDRETAYELGANFYIRKSDYSPKEIVEMINIYNMTGEWQQKTA